MYISIQIKIPQELAKRREHAREQSREITKDSCVRVVQTFRNVVGGRQVEEVRQMCLYQMKAGFFYCFYCPFNKRCIYFKAFHASPPALQQIAALHHRIPADLLRSECSSAAFQHHFCSTVSGLCSLRTSLLHHLRLFPSSFLSSVVLHRTHLHMQIYCVTVYIRV